MLDVEAKSLGSTHQCPRKQAAEIPTSVLKVWWDLVSDSKSGIAGRLCAWSSRATAAAGLRWGDLLNTSPTTLVLLKKGPIGLAAKTKTRGKSRGRPRGAGNFAFSNEEWISTGFRIFKEKPVDFPRDFWISQPLFLESELGPPTRLLPFGLALIK